MRWGMLTLALLLSLSGGGVAQAYKAHPLRTGFTLSGDGDSFSPSNQELSAERVRDAGARMLRIEVSWSNAAPTRPANPTNPSDPAYDWSSVDAVVDLAVRHGLTPSLQLTRTPDWASAGAGDGPPVTRAARPADFGAFALAAARRYSGNPGAKPRVREWAALNEPNHGSFFTPQRDGTRELSPGLYRALVQKFSEAVKSVHQDNIVIAGELAPFQNPIVIAPVDFLRTMLCLPGGQTSGCGSLPVDVISVHPYTSGDAYHKASTANGVSLGNLPSFGKLVDSASSQGKIATEGKPGLWVTEFSWDSAPPDPKGVPAKLERRWVAEALYRSWRSGVTTFTWFLLRDDRRNPSSTTFDSGLYYRCATGVSCDKEKPALAAFRFPLVAFKSSKGKALVWARTPAGIRKTVIVEQRVGTKWSRVAKLRTDEYGIIYRKITLRGSGILRARAGSSIAPSFSLKRPKDRPGAPFGS